MFSTCVQLRNATGSFYKPSDNVNVDASCYDKTKNVKYYFIRDDNVPLIYVRELISQFNIFLHKFKTVYGNEIAKSFDNL